MQPDMPEIEMPEPEGPITPTSEEITEKMRKEAARRGGMRGVKSTMLGQHSMAGGVALPYASTVLGG